MKIEKILKIDTTVEDKIVMIFSNNIDIVYCGEPAVSIDKFEQLRMEILLWHKSEVEKLHLPVVRHSSLIPITDEKPLAYESGEWDGLRSDLVLVKNNRDDYTVGRLYSSKMDGSEFEEWYTDDDYEIQGEIVGWQKLPR